MRANITYEINGHKVKLISYDGQKSYNVEVDGQLRYRICKTTSKGITYWIPGATPLGVAGTTDKRVQDRIKANTAFTSREEAVQFLLQ